MPGGRGERPPLSVGRVREGQLPLEFPHFAPSTLARVTGTPVPVRTVLPPRAGRPRRDAPSAGPRGPGGPRGGAALSRILAPGGEVRGRAAALRDRGTTGPGRRE